MLVWFVVMVTIIIIKIVFRMMRLRIMVRKRCKWRMRRIILLMKKMTMKLGRTNRVRGGGRGTLLDQNEISYQNHYFTKIE